MKYVIYKDYKTGVHQTGYDYITIDANDAFDLFEIADKEWAAERNRLYLMRIMKKTGRAAQEEHGWKRETYEAIMCKRSDEVGWHKNTNTRGEGKHVAERHYKKDMEWFKTIC